MKIRRVKRQGFAIVSAIFILVVLAALGAFILSVSSQQQIGSALDVQGARAYQAARAGIEWGLYQQLQGGVDCPAGDFVPPAATLAEFTVSVTCVATADPAGHGGPVVRVLTATACNQPHAGACPNTVNPGAHYIERRLQVTF